MFFLNLLGIPYPDVDVDQVRELGQDVREFAADIRDSYDAATNTIGDMGSDLTGNSYQTILVVWSLRQEKMAELNTAFEVAATAIEISADVIEAIQIAVLIELAALAASFVASMFTPAGPVTGPVIAAAARWLLKEMAKALMWYVAAEVMMKAIEPLVEKFDQLIRDSLLPPDFVMPSPGSDGKFSIDPDAVARHVNDLKSRADEITSHGEKFGNKLDTLDFSTPGLEVPRAEWPYPDTDEPITVPTQPGTLPSTLPSWVPEMMRALPAWLPEVNQPGLDTTSSTTPNGGSSTSGQPNADSPSGQAASAPAGTGSNDPGAASPTVSPNASSVGTPGGTPSSLGMPASAGIDSSGQARSLPDGGAVGQENSGYDAEQSGTGPVQNAGDTTAVIPPGTTQAAAAASGQPQATPTQSGQRSPDTAANKGQAGAGAGRGPTGAGSGAQQPSAPKTRATPWSRAGKKPVRVVPTVERPDEKVPAISTGETGGRGETVPKPQSAAEDAGRPAAQVFVPIDVEAPAQASREETGHDAHLDVAAESEPRPTDQSPVGSRRPGPE